MQELASVHAPGPGAMHHGAARYPFMHVAPEQSVDVVASKLLASQKASSCITLCSLPLGEVYGSVSAIDLVRALRGPLEGVRFEPRKESGVALSPRLWPSPSAEQARVARPGSATRLEGPSKKSRVTWLDESRGVALAEVFRYEAELSPKPEPQGPPAVLALEDGPQGGAGQGAVSLSRFKIRLKPMTPEMLRDRAIQDTAALTPRASPSDDDEGELLSPSELSAVQHPLLRQQDQAICEGPGWSRVMQGAVGDSSSASSVGRPPAGGEHVGMWGASHGEQLQLVLYQQRDLVLYDRRQNRAFARRLTEEQAGALATKRGHFCPLCRQRLNPSWAFVVEGYFEMLGATSGMPSTSGSSNMNEEAAAAADLHNIPVGLLNVGYYSRFFVEERKLGAGSFGAVYLCRHVMDEIELGVFAVKKLALGDDAKRLRQVVREIKALERLRHVNIVDYKHSWLEVSRLLLLLLPLVLLPLRLSLLILLLLL